MCETDINELKDICGFFEEQANALISETEEVLRIGFKAINMEDACNLIIKNLRSSDAESVQRYMDEIYSSKSDTAVNDGIISLRVQFAAMANASLALKLWHSGRYQSGLFYLLQAVRWQGFSFAAWGSPDIFIKGVVQFAKLGAKARHYENNQVKREVIDWYKNNKANYANKDDAAMAAMNLFPYKFSTLRGWLKKQ